jgi:hypothetical protein
VHVYLSKYSPRELPPLSEDSARQVPPPGVHPLVRTHPENGRKALYVNPVRIEGIVGMEDEEALDLVGELMEHALQKKYEYRHQWNYGDFVIWDNRSVRYPQSQPGLRHERAAVPLPSDAEGRDAGLIEDGAANRATARKTPRPYYATYCAAACTAARGRKCGITSSPTMRYCSTILSFGVVSGGDRLMCCIPG